jgi:hypothetical protein
MDVVVIASQAIVLSALKDSEIGEFVVTGRVDPVQ